MIDTFLQISVYGQINVTARLRSRLRNGFPDMSHIIYINWQVPFCTLKCGFHSLLNSWFAYDIIQFIIRVFLPEKFQLTFLHTSYISNDRRKVDTVIIFTDCGFFYIYSWQFSHMFQNICHCGSINIRRNFNRFILFIRSQPCCVPDIHNLKCFFLCHEQRISFFVFQFIQFVMAIPIPEKFLSRNLRRKFSIWPGKLFWRFQSKYIT